MENKNTCGCDCTMCHVGHRRRYRWLMIVVGAVLAFGVGMKLGEIKGYMMSNGYGYEGGMHQRGWTTENYRGGNMMYGTVVPVVAPAPAVAPVVAPKN